MNIDNFLDLWDIWVNELVGSVWLFIFFGIVLIAFLSAKAKFSMEITILLEVLFLTIIFAYIYFTFIWVLVILGIGALFYFIYQKTIRQG